ncbi:FeoB-associated Cys-rich membrane protein [Faecalicatena contorta]|uniref:FeoB-associated Cys-rich membrane protein n=1 Tax=Faecalicatena contorta TaxID=39482 RepID=UPI001F48B39A|nr:FeoB-associated Cys-rich membrane protein [Faecalicatena contorta]MCF2679277.1 FeoB-associated Cys-rich membrane protein [Faecalicatena contorta]
MILAAKSSVLSTAVVGAILFIMIVLIIKSMWKRRKEGASCMGCSGSCTHCNRKCSSENVDRLHKEDYNL